ncbi:unnamed protein product [Candidula unifasciata]|uniref:HMG box domain-containing protein n=1 Tax=Candidula unifasciata TaxID=100452 RepID=A0A8S3YDL1_9EUPU|nr:unnamed protein product [Candidula unifasciata]
MSKRDFEFEDMRKDDQDDGGASARSGRVRKKSAKVLEMEEFEQVEKTQLVTKKGKTPKIVGKMPTEQDSPFSDKTPPVKKMKITKPPVVGALSATLDLTPLSSKVVKAVPAKSELSAHQTKPVQQFVSIQTSGILTRALPGDLTLSPTDLMTTTLKPEYETDLSIMSDLGLQQQILQHSPVRSEDQKSVIKYLLSSPSAGSKPSVSTTVFSRTEPSPVLISETPAAAKKPTKKPPKSQDAGAVKMPKSKKVKADDMTGVEQPGAGLKIKIFSSSDPSTAQVTLSTHTEQTSPAKLKKQPKKIKQIETEHDFLMDTVDVLGLSKVNKDELADTSVKKTKKVSKKKEKLIQDAISAAQQVPNLAALVASQTLLPSQLQEHLVSQSSLFTPGQKPFKPQKKKMKTVSPLSGSASSSDDPNDSLGKSDLSFGDDGEESHLVIAETERKKKKQFSKKKVLLHKDKSESDSPKGDKGDKKLSKRAPTAYMLFCNTHRAAIVNENPGIEFAAISRRLGEMWQNLSNKQKLQWRRKAQRRRKKGSNLISTGKAGRESGSLTHTPVSSIQSHQSPGLKLSAMMQKAQRSSPEDTPQSPTKNFSIEPIDVAAHLKLLGESLSIIGMRLQEHKGMIAVQGSLSVLLDSLLCACGPLLCLTQQVPGMDGCSPLVHAQTLDSVAYVMPGL